MNTATPPDRDARPRPAAPPPSTGTGAPVASAAAPLLSEHLLCGRKTVEINHNGAVYRLQATRQGKLILTK